MEYVKSVYYFFQLSCIYFFNKVSLISYLKAKIKTKTKPKTKHNEKPKDIFSRKLLIILSFYKYSLLTDKTVNKTLTLLTNLLLTKCPWMAYLVSLKLFLLFWLVYSTLDLKKRLNMFMNVFFYFAF